jgi:hypothetical protein
MWIPSTTLPCEEIERGNRERCENSEAKLETPWRIEKRDTRSEAMKRFKDNCALNFKHGEYDSRK